jgi:hypothetical protein
LELGLPRCGEAPSAKDSGGTPHRRLESRTRRQNRRLSSSPLVATVGRRRRMGEAQPTGRNTRDKLPRQVRVPRAAPPTPLATKAGQRRQQSSISPHQRRSCHTSPPPLVSTAGQRRRHRGKEPHLQKDEDDIFIEGCGGTLHHLLLRPSELEEGKEEP